MDVMDCRCHTDDPAIQQRNSKMMSWVSQELSRPAWIDRVVEDAGSDAIKYVGVVGLEEMDGRGQFRIYD